MLEKGTSIGKVIWIVNQYASHLEERHLNLAINFASKGYRIVVITSSFHHGNHEYLYDDKIRIVKRSENVYFAYLKPSPPYQANGKKRILNMLDFCKSYIVNQVKIAKEVGKPNYLIASSAPPFMWEIGFKTVKKYRAKFIVEFRDIWPLSLIEVQGTSPHHPIVKAFGTMERRAYKHADAIVGTMPYAYKHVCDDMGFPRSKMHWMPNGLDIEKAEKGGELLSKDIDQFLSSHWCCIYIGSIVKSESIDYLIKAWSKVKNKAIYFAIIGDGNASSQIDNMIKDLGGERIKHFKSIKKEQIPMALKKAQCCLAAIPNYPIYRFGLSMNKLSDYLFSGKPVIFACGVDNVVREGGGFVLPFGDQQLMAETIEKVYQLSENDLKKIADSETKIIREKYDYKVIAENYMAMIESL